MRPTLSSLYIMKLNTTGINYCTVYFQINYGTAQFQAKTVQPAQQACFTFIEPFLCKGQEELRFDVGALSWSVELKLSLL